jgi:hypothetical protein
MNYKSIEEVSEVGRIYILKLARKQARYAMFVP